MILGNLTYYSGASQSTVFVKSGFMSVCEGKFLFDQLRPIKAFTKYVTDEYINMRLIWEIQNYAILERDRKGS